MIGPIPGVFALWQGDDPGEVLVPEQKPHLCGMRHVTGLMCDQNAGGCMWVSHHHGTRDDGRRFAWPCGVNDAPLEAVDDNDDVIEPGARGDRR